MTHGGRQKVKLVIVVIVLGRWIIEVYIDRVGTEVVVVQTADAFKVGHESLRVVHLSVGIHHAFHGLLGIKLGVEYDVRWFGHQVKRRGCLQFIGRHVHVLVHLGLR